MGRGDRKTRKGKIAIRSYGNVRPHAEGNAVADKPKSASAATKTAAKTAVKPAAKKAAPAKKAAAKKTA
ncbi:MAG: 30S ribosomal protein THX [Xanthomonadales bacterium]|nr:30S ribosomal protein THX [Xanthomonadales bacterium]